VAATVEALTVALADSKLKLRELKRAVGGPVLYPQSMSL
jgi:hypothetical protein